MTRPRNEAEWRREVERRLATHGSAISNVSGLIIPAIQEQITVGKQPAAPIELVASTSIYTNMAGQWRGRFILDFPDVVVAVDGTPIAVSWYELQGKSGGTFAPSASDDTISISKRSAEARALAPRIGAGGSLLIGATKATGTAKAYNPSLRAYDAGAPWRQVATSDTSSLRVDNLEPGSMWTFRARAYSDNSVKPGAWSAEVNVTILRDTLAPAQLSQPIVNVSRGTITVTWDGETVVGQVPGDFAYAELAQGTDPAPTEIVARFYGEGGFTVISNAPYYDPQFFRIRAVDTSGNKGAWSQQAVAYVTPLVDEDVILSKIDAAQTLLINVDASVSILSSTILTRHLVVTEDMTVALLAAHKIVAGDIAANAVTVDKLAAGAVTAEKLTSTLVLSSKIIAGNELGTHAQMDQDGFRVFAQDNSGDGVPKEVVRMGVASTDDYFALTGSSGEMVASISQEGILSAKSGTFAGDIIMLGDSLDRRISQIGGRMAAWGQVPIDTTNMQVNSPGEEVGLYELAWDTTGDDPPRMYEFNANEFLVTSGGTGIVGLRLRYTTDGSTPTINSPLIGYKYQNVTTGNTASFGITRIIGSNNGNYLRVVVCLYTAGPSATVYSGTGQTHLFSTVKDLGETIPHTAVATMAGGGVSPPAPTPAPVTTTRTFYATGSRSYYTSSGAWYNWNTAYMFSGLSPAGVGDLKSLAIFPSMTSYLSGATINWIKVYVYYDHWYYNSGGTARIGLHGYSSIPGTMGAVSNITTSANWPKPGGRWVTLPSAYYAGFKSGAYKGITLGGTNGGLIEYGYAHDARIQISYTK